MILILCLLLLPVSVLAQTSMPVDSLYYRSDFHYAQEEIDEKLLNSPQVILLLERHKAQKHSNTFFTNLSFHLTYSPFEELIPESRLIWIGFNIPLGKIFQNTKELDAAELNMLLVSSKLQSRQLMKQRREILEGLELDIKMYRTAALKLQKSEVELSVKQMSSDEVMSAGDSLSQLLVQIRKKRFEVRLTEDKLKALIGEL